MPNPSLLPAACVLQDERRDQQGAAEPVAARCAHMGGFSRLLACAAAGSCGWLLFRVGKPCMQHAGTLPRGSPPPVHRAGSVRHNDTRWWKRAGEFSSVGAAGNCLTYVLSLWCAPATHAQGTGHRGTRLARTGLHPGGPLSSLEATGQRHSLPTQPRGSRPGVAMPPLHPAAPLRPGCCCRQAPGADDLDKFLHALLNCGLCAEPVRGAATQGAGTGQGCAGRSRTP